MHVPYQRSIQKLSQNGDSVAIAFAPTGVPIDCARVKKDLAETASKDGTRCHTEASLIAKTLFEARYGK